MENKDHQLIKNLIYDWVKWLSTRRFYAPPIQKNILDSLMTRDRMRGEPPNAENNALCCAFNLVLSNARETDNSDYLCFINVYLPEFRPEPIKTFAARLSIDSDTVYKRAHKAAVRYYNKSLQLQVLNSQMQKEVQGFVEDFS